MAARSTITARNKFPVIVILGSTGVGKTKLSIELSKRLNGEVISADSMQVYKGLDIITAKATLSERAQCKHHMIDIINPLENFNVVKFRNMALPIIMDITERGKVPIIVGGTNYYIESLLWDILVSNDENTNEEANGPSSNNENSSREEGEKRTEGLVQSSKYEQGCKSTDENVKNYDFRGSEKEQLEEEGNHLENAVASRDYENLRSIDPVAASRVHPNDRRKVKRQLDMWKQTGRLPSDVINEQQRRDGGDHLGGPLRFTNALVFWLTCNQSALDKRICERVDSMLADGLVEEISHFYDEYNSKLADKPADFAPYKEGIFQAIGFKEFHKYLTSTVESKEESNKLLKEGIMGLKRITIRYSKKQRTWVKNRFLQRPFHSSPNVYQLDASVIEKWNETALKPALEAAELFLSGKDVRLTPMERLPKDPNDNAHRQYICSICDEKLIVGDSVWKKHCQSKKHKKQSARKRKLDSSSFDQ